MQKNVNSSPVANTFDPNSSPRHCAGCIGKTDVLISIRMHCHTQWIKNHTKSLQVKIQHSNEKLIDMCVVSEGVFVPGAFLLCLVFVTIEPNKSAGVKACGSAKNVTKFARTPHTLWFFFEVNGENRTAKNQWNPCINSKLGHSNSANSWPTPLKQRTQNHLGMPANKSGLRDPTTNGYSMS